MTENEVFGQQIGRYTILEKLGQGGMAAVYNALDSVIERNVALKVILPSRQTSQVFLDRFVVEARSLANLTHTNIVKVLDYGEEDGLPYLVMEYIPGGTLKEFMNQPLPYDQAAAILAPIARALDYVHKQKIIHRDVKPSNILVDENDQPMLSDFGVVKLLETEETEDMAVGVGIGTPDYMSPEQGMGKKVDFRADIYALGVVFYEMITGHKPFTAESPMAVVIKHVTSTFPRPRQELKQLPPIVEAVIMRAVAKDPEKRFSDMGRFAEALEELAKGPKARIPRIRKLLQLQRKPLLSPLARRIVLAVVLLAILVGLGSAGWLYWPMIEKTPAGRWIVQNLPKPVPSPIVAAVVSTATQPAAAVTPTATPTKQLPTATIAPTAEASKPAETPTQKPTLEPTQIAGDAYTLAMNASLTLPLEGTPVPKVSKRIDSTTPQQIGLWGIGGINTIKWSRSMDIVVLGTTDGIFAYNSKTLERIAYINTQNWVETIAFSPDGLSIAAGLRNGQTLYINLSKTLHVANLMYSKADTDETKDATAPAIALAFSSTQRYLAIGYKNGTISVWDLSGETPNRVFTGKKYTAVTGLLFSADNRYLYAIKGDALMTVWDINSASVDRELNVVSSVSVITETLDHKYYLLGGDARSVLIYDPNAEKTLVSFLGLEDAVREIAAAPDNSRVAIGLANGLVKVFKIPTSEEMKKYQQAQYTLKVHPDAVTGLEFSTDSTRLLSGSWRIGLKAWDAASGKEAAAINPNMQPVTRMVFSPDGGWLVVEDTSRTVKIWNAKDGTVVQTFPGVIPSGRGFSQDSKYLMVAQEAKNTWEDGTILIISVPDAQVVKKLTGYRAGWQIDFSPDGKLLVGGTLQSAVIWDTSTWERLKIHGGSDVSCGKFYTPESQLLATIWEEAIFFKYDSDMEKLCATRPGFATAVELLPDQSAAIYQLKDGRLWFWDYTEDSFNFGRNVEFISSERNAKAGRDTLLALHNNSLVMVIYVDNKDVGVYTDRYTYARQSGWKYQNKAEYLYRAAISPDGTILALGSQYGAITLWGIP